jgi:spermidine synthase
MAKKEQQLQLLLLFSVFVIATCGLIYELVAGTLASYLLGDSVTQFSTIIGVYLFSMGIGAYLSRYFDKNLLNWFVNIEILVGLVGGFSAAALFMLFNYIESFRLVLYLLVMLTGTLVGLEIPILMNILKNRLEFKELVSRVFTFDYIGALLASLIFPLLLVPHLGLMRTAFLFGILNVLVALLLCFKLKEELKNPGWLKTKALLAIAVLVAGFIASDRLLAFSETGLYGEKIIFARSSVYQRIVLTRNNQDIRLYLNNNLQFSSRDEYRYHEALVHPVMTRAASIKKVLILGGGDGMAAREILKYPEVEQITLVDLDPAMTSLFRENELLKSLNHQSLLNPRLKVVNTDAFQWLKQNHDKFDVAIIDFPDPSNYSVGKLYTSTFYNTLRAALTPASLIVIQSTSPYVAPQSFWCVNNTLEQSGFQTMPFHTYVPSFGEWGYVMASLLPVGNTPKRALPPQLRYYTEATFAQMTAFPADMAARSTAINKLNNQALVQYFEDEWSKY